MQAQDQPIRLTLADGIATVELNRPRVLNAMDDASLIAATAMIQELGRNQECRVVVITGSPDSRAFCAGSDIREYVGISPTQIRQHGVYQHEMHRAIEEIPQPVIAAVHGYAVGGGMELTLACDFRVASEDARFGLPEVNIGVLPGGGGVWRLARLIGLSRAKEMAMLGSTITAAQAHSWGLVHQLAPAGQALQAATTLAEELKQKDAMALAAVKQLSHHALSADTGAIEALELQLLSMCSTETAFQTLVRAKLAKRT